MDEPFNFDSNSGVNQTEFTEVMSERGDLAAVTAVKRRQRSQGV
jgi:hypothetical protein